MQSLGTAIGKLTRSNEDPEQPKQVNKHFKKGLERRVSFLKMPHNKPNHSVVRGPTNLGYFFFNVQKSNPLVVALHSLLMVSLCHPQAYQRLQIQQQMLQAQRNISGPMRQQEQQVGAPGRQSWLAGRPSPDLVRLSLMMAVTGSRPLGKPRGHLGWVGWAQAAPPAPLTSPFPPPPRRFCAQSLTCSSRFSSTSASWPRPCS